MEQPTFAEVSVQEQPVFGIGMCGFGPDERTALESQLGARDALPGWRSCTFPEADAWWVNGARVQLMPDGSLRVTACTPSCLQLKLTGIDRPIAFATPLAPADFEPHWSFDPRSRPSIDWVLMQFDAWLWQARAQFVLGSRIVEAGERLKGGVYHVSHEGRLLAVLDFERGRAAILPGTRAEALWEARWDKRPCGAHDLPESFIRTTPAELAWTYVRHTDRDMLPDRYRHCTIHYRRTPRVPSRMLRDSQLLILCELALHGATLDELERRTALPRARIENDLACLYYANAVTTQQRSAFSGDDSMAGSFFEGVQSELPGLRDPSNSPPESNFAALMFRRAAAPARARAGA